MLEDIREVRRAPGRCCGATAHGDQGLYLVRAVAPSSRTKANIASSLSHADRTDGRDAGDFGSLLAGLGLWLTNGGVPCRAGGWVYGDEHAGAGECG